MNTDSVSSENMENDHNNSTINLDDSEVLSSTKHDSSVLEISSSSSSQNDDIIVVEDESDGDTINTKEDKPELSMKDDEDDLADRNVEVCSSSDDGQDTTEDHYVTSVQSPFQLSVNADRDINSSVDTCEASQLLSSANTTINQLPSDPSSTNTTVGDRSHIEALQNELANHPRKMSELMSEGLGEVDEKDMLTSEVNDELYNSILAGGTKSVVNDVEDYNLEEVTNACLTLSVNDDNVIVKKIDLSNSSESGNKLVEETVTKNAVLLNGDTESSPKKRKSEEEALSNSVNEVSINKDDVLTAASMIEGSLLESSDGERSDIEDNDEDSESDMMRIPTGLPPKRQRIADPDLPKTVQVLYSAKSGAKVYLIGTAHFSKESCEDVAKVIEGVQPDIVMIELCKARTNMLHLDDETILEEAKNLNFEKSMDIIKQQGAVQGGMYIALLSMSAHLTRELGMAPGGEFRRAFAEAQKVPGCMVHLGDRPIGITLKRALQALSTWQKIKLASNILLTSMDKITPEDVEKCKERDLLENMLAEMAGEFPALSRVFVSERDIFLSHSLQMAADAIPVHAIAPGGGLLEGFSPPVVVGVVGIGHVPGIVNNWGTVKKEDIREIVKIEPPSKMQIAVKFAFKTAFLGGCLYGAYRIGRIPVSRFLLSR